MTEHEIWIYAVGIIALCVVCVIDNRRRERSRKKTAVSLSPKPSPVYQQGMLMSDAELDWGDACNQLCLGLYGVIHPSAASWKTPGFWYQEFMDLVDKATPEQAASFLRELDEKEAAFSQSVSDNDSVPGAWKVIRCYLQQIKK